MAVKQCRRSMVRYLWVFSCLGLCIHPAWSDEVAVAVAANFIEPAKGIAAAFEAETGHHVTVSAASTGKLYAQITHGAPFDVFLAADSQAPAKLEEHGFAVAGTRFTYAVGQLVLWSRDPRLDLNDGEAVLRSGGFAHLALANPRTAPYGAAAMAVLQRMGLEHALAGRLVRAEDVGQAFQFAATRNAELAFVALSQTSHAGTGLGGSVWRVPSNWYTPINQEAVLLVRARQSAAARAFLAYLRGPTGAAMVERFGYARAEHASVGSGLGDTP